MTAPIHYRSGTVPIADIRNIATQFQLDGEFISADRYGSGHINDTYVVSTSSDGRIVRFILQRINKLVFADPLSLMENVRRVTGHLCSKAGGERHCLSLVATHDGDCCLVDPENNCWRVYRFIEDAYSVDEAESTAQAREAAAAFGRFQKMVYDLPAPRLHDTIPGFHDAPARIQQFREALEQDRHGRSHQCSAEIDLARSFEEAAGVLDALKTAGDLPERISHNDTKINNLLFDESSDKALCVIDLDTVMPGLALYDFGDLVRTATTSAAEDETDLTRINMRMDYFEAVADGYLGAALDFLTEAEIGQLAVAGKVMTIETGLRFLTDFLAGDNYFRTHRPQHNLDRCRAQFALAASIDEQLGDMQQAVDGIVSGMKSEQGANRR